MSQKIKTILLAFLTLFVTGSLIVFPEQAFEASIRGLHIWWEIVFPSLLPFFIAAELLIGFGIVQFIGVLFEPIMRPLFNVPGVGSFAWIMGMASGYPSGAKITVQLRQKNELSKFEAERLLSFTNASSPLFIFGAIAVGFFHNAQLGILIAFCHYFGNTLVGICMRFHGNKKEVASQNKLQINRIIINAFSKMHRTRLNEKRPFGQVIGDAVINSVNTLLMIGGFIILFSVFTKILSLVKVISIISLFLLPFQLLFQLPQSVITPFITGIFEITMGVELISKLQAIPLITQLTIVSFILGFNGFSVQAQVASIIAKTDIRFAPYFFSRILHGIFASLLTIIFFQTLYVEKQGNASHQTFGDNAGTSYFYDLFEIIIRVGPLITIISLTCTILILFIRYVNDFHNCQK